MGKLGLEKLRSQVTEERRKILDNTNGHAPLFPIRIDAHIGDICAHVCDIRTHMRDIPNQKHTTLDKLTDTNLVFL